MDPRLAQYITNFLFGAQSSRTNIVEFQRFAELYVYSTRGTYDDRISVLLASVGDSNSDEIAYPLIKEVASHHFAPNSDRIMLMSQKSHIFTVRRSGGEQLYACHATGRLQLQIVGEQGLSHRQRVHTKVGRKSGARYRPRRRP